MILEFNTLQIRSQVGLRSGASLDGASLDAERVSPEPFASEDAHSVLFDGLCEPIGIVLKLLPESALRLQFSNLIRRVTQLSQYLMIVFT